MSWKSKTACLCFSALCALHSRAGELAKEGEQFAQSCGSLFSPFSFAGVAKCGGILFTGKPLHLLIPQSVVPGGGSALGLTYTHEFNRGKWQNNVTLDAGSSLRAFWLADAVVTFSHDKLGGEWNTARDRFQIQLYAHALGLPRMPFYGIGPNTSRSNLVDYRERYVSNGVNIFVPLKSWLAVGGDVEGLFPNVGGVTDPGVRSITTFFTEATAPGLAHSSNFSHYEFFIDPRYERGRAEFRYHVRYGFYQDHSGGTYSFRRFRIDALNQFFPEGKKRVATTDASGQAVTETRYDSVFYIYGRLTTSNTGANNVVPFYFQETLGGSDIEGLPTLRGFQDYRFRAPNLMLIQLQFERRIKGPIGFMIFYDTGEVANHTGDLSFSDLRHSFGGGLTFWSGAKVVLRAYVGLGSGEGHHTFFGVPNLSGTQTHL